jgi:glyoxylase I family protein
MNPHRGLLHHLNINVSNVKRSAGFYGPFFRYLGYERSGFQHEGERAFEDWKRWLEGTPHEISIVQADGNATYDPSERRSVGRHNHIAFCAEDRNDVDRLYREILVPLEREGLCVVEDPPCDCPEYGEGYYATFFFDPDGLKFEFVTNPNYFRMKKARDDGQARRPC